MSRFVWEVVDDGVEVMKEKKRKGCFLGNNPGCPFS